MDKSEGKFNSDEEISRVLDSVFMTREASVLFVLAAINALMVKNKKGIEFGVLCYILSEVSTMCTRREFHMLIGILITAGLLSHKDILDSDGDSSALVFLANEKIGSYATRELLNDLPEFYDKIDKLKETDAAEIKRDYK